MANEMTEDNVFDYIKQEENYFQTQGVPIVDGWEFNMHDHIRRTTLYKYGQLFKREKTDDDPVENIILPILNVAYRLEDIDVKDITPYVDDKSKHYKSFIVKKFHDRWARKNEVDTFIDQTKTSWIDFGLGVAKNVKKPEYVPLQRLAFCDQTDILSGPICEKHYYTIEQLNEMKGKWDEDAIDEAIMQARKEKTAQQVKAQKQKTPSPYIEIYELHGMFPETWNPKISKPDSDKYSRQIHIVTYYRDEDNKQHGLALYQGLESENIYDAVKRDEVYGRACGYGGAEELFEPQVWHTYSRIQMKEMLDVAAAMIVLTADSGLAKRQRVGDLEKGEILEEQADGNTRQLAFSPINWEVFDRWREDMKLAAQTQGSANDPQMGVEPKSGTAWGLQRLTVQQGQQIHQYRKGLFATFLERLYRTRFLQNMVQELNKGDEWLEEFDLDEVKWLSEKISENRKNKRIKELILQGKSTTKAEMEEYKENLKDQMFKNDNKEFITVLKNEFKSIPLDVKINIADKQKDLGAEGEKIVSFVTAIISNPQMLTAPGMDDLLNQVIEYAGLDPVDFDKVRQSISQQAMEQAQQIQQAPQQQQAQ